MAQLLRVRHRCCFQTSGSLKGTVGSQFSPLRSHQIVVIRDRMLLPGKAVSTQVSTDFLCTGRSSSDSSCCCVSPACALQEAEMECTKHRMLMYPHSPHLSTVSDNIKYIRSLCFCDAGYSLRNLLANPLSFAKSCQQEVFRKLTSKGTQLIK